MGEGRANPKQTKSKGQSAPKVRHKILAVASGGGHWVQLLRLLPAFDDQEVVFVTVNRMYGLQVRSSRLYVVPDASRWNKFALARMALRMAWVVIRERPDFVVSTGAAIGYFALRFGKLFGARTIWVDSMANVEQLSLSGTRSGPYADLWLTQWPHLARPGGPQFMGSVL